VTRAARGWVRPAVALVAILLLGSTHGADASRSGARLAPTQGAAGESGRAWRLVDLAAGRTIDEGRPDVLARPVSPGSIVKIATLIAALEAGLIAPRTRIACPGSVEVRGRRIACLHPRVRHPLPPDEALAYSCNVFFAQVGERLPRARLDGVLAEMGLPASPPGAAPALAATGIAASAVAPEALLRAMMRVVSDPPGVNMRAPTRATVMAGLRGGARFGTAAALAKRGVDALAKTGSAASPGGGQHGLVVVAWPAARPARVAVVMLAGAGGSDAADVAARLARDGRLPPAAQVAATAAVRPAAPTPAVDAPASRGTGPGEEAPPPVAAAAPSPAPAPQTPAPAAASATVLGGVAALPATVRVGLARGSGYVQRDMPLEEYVAHVLAGEAAPRSTRAVLEALAITVRTFALANRGRHAHDGFDLCDLTHCQVLRPPYESAHAAAAATRGLVLAAQGAPAQVFYTASCGGRSERPSNVWPGSIDPPHLPSREDDGCRGEPRWSAEISASDLVRALRAAGYRGATLRDMRVVRRSNSGRVTTLRLNGFTPEDISGQNLRMAVGRTLGWHLVKSTSFELSRTGQGYRFKGRGFGHGVGMCVIGATNRSASGWSRERLLKTYFPGLAVTPLANLRQVAAAGAAIAPETEPLASGDAAAVEAAGPAMPAVSATPPAGAKPPAPAGRTTSGRDAVARQTPTRVRLMVPAQEEAQRRMLSTLIEDLLASTIARAGRHGPSEIQVVVQPTSGAFQRATGQPWWSSGSSRAARIDLQPLSVLRERGTLEQTLAHELGHVITAPVTRGRAAWVVEGAAMYVGGLIDTTAIEAAGAAEPVTCPADTELRSPASAERARDAYARARTCFARALASGTRWQDVR
jgi:stage II sporulation protein D